MIDAHRCCQITPRHAHQGLHASQSASALARDPRTVASWLAQEPVHPRPARPHTSTRDPLHAQRARLLER